MYGGDDNLGCLQGSIERVGKGLRGGVERIGRGLSGNIGLVCSVSEKEEFPWRWDDGNIILWDNKEKVLIKKQ